MPTYEQRQALCSEPCWLDGERAVLRGAANRFATVMRADGKGGPVEFAWPTAARIMGGSAQFRS